MTTTGILAIVAAPALVLLMRGRLLVLLPTIITTWLVVTFALAYMLPDPSDISTWFLFFLIIIPSLGIPFAAVVATRLAKLRGHFSEALAMALLGWIVGLVVSFLVDMAFVHHGLPYYFWDYAEALALPACYAGSAAAWAASVQR